MQEFSILILNTRLWAMLCLGALGLTVLLSLFGHLVAPRLWDATSQDMKAAPHDPAISRTLALEELRQMVAAQR